MEDAHSIHPPPPSFAAAAAAAAAPPDSLERPMVNRIFESSDPSKGGVSVAVVDANAVINGDRLAGLADRYVSVKEVLDEVRDPASRRRVAFLPFTIETMEPSPEFIKKVVKFARETGDLQTLSDVDLKIIALTYMLESLFHSTNHLRESPPPLRTVNVRNLRDTQLPGWGKNVPNLAEWEAIEQLNEGGITNSGSRILPLKNLDSNSNTGDNGGGEEKEVVLIPNSGNSGNKKNNVVEAKKEVDLMGKKMVAQGINASKGEERENDTVWMPAVSRNTHRRYLRRKARREELARVQQEEERESNSEVMEGQFGDLDDVSTEEDSKLCVGEMDRLEIASHEGELDKFERGSQNENNTVMEGEEMMHKLERESEDENSVCMEGGEEEGLDKLERESENGESVNEGSTISEQSWMLKSLSDSSVACITSDYAMQNVILQIGLRLLAPGGMQIRQLHRWVLKCHACNKVTQEIGRIFCPKCGNGGTLRKVSVTVGENGIVMAARRQRFILRGTKFSLPLPQGGREAITKNPVLREDQLPHKFLHPKQKKNPTKQDEDYLMPDSIFSHAGERREPLKPPVRKALTMFSGKRNPNDNHFSRRKA